jgi:hypothetical protein
MHTTKTIDLVKGASKTGADSEESQVYRLTDMVVREVSAVDRAANKRTFLMYKSATRGPELEPDGKGGFRVRKEEAPAPEALAQEPPEQEPQAAEKAQPEAAPDASLEPSATMKLEVPDALVQGLAGAFAEVEKVGRKVSRETESRLRQAVELIMEVLADAVAAVEESTKSLTATRAHAADLSKQLAAVTQEHTRLRETHAAYVRNVHLARSTVPTSKVLRPEGGQAQVGGPAVTWPTDLTRELESDPE